MNLDLTKKITYGDLTTGGRAFQCGTRTAAHLDFTKERLEVVRPGARLLIIQGCYNTGVAASAGTHDFDAVLDVEIIDADGSVVDWAWSQRFLRECGWAAFWRTVAQGFANHIHMISLGYVPAPVGVFVPAQVDDYYRGALGLKGQHDSGDDPSWHPDDIDSTVFDYQEWELDNMLYRDWPQADKDALAQDVAAVTAVATAEATVEAIGNMLVPAPDPTKAPWRFKEYFPRLWTHMTNVTKTKVVK